MFQWRTLQTQKVISVLQMTKISKKFTNSSSTAFRGVKDRSDFSLHPRGSSQRDDRGLHLQRELRLSRKELHRKREKERKKKATGSSSCSFWSEEKAKFTVDSGWLPFLICLHLKAIIFCKTFNMIGFTSEQGHLNLFCVNVKIQD